MRILLLALCLIAAALYVKILLPPDHELAGLLPGGTQIEQPATQEQAAEPVEASNLREVPESQMQVVRDVFAPELAR